MLNFRQLKTFLMVAEQKSFTKAARELFMTQPAVSSQIKAMEEFLEINLIERLDKKVVLTEAGITFAKEARKILALYDEAIFTLDEIKGVQRGKLKIGASTIPGEYILPRYIGAFKEKFANIQIALHIADTGAVINALKDRKIDIGITGARVNDKEIIFNDFITDELIAIAHPQNILFKSNVPFAEVMKSPIILREASSGTRMVINQHLAAKNIAQSDLSVVMELGSTRAVISAVEANLGFSIISKWAAADALKLNKIVQLDIPELEIKRMLYIATHRTKSFSHAAEKFMKFLLAPDISKGANL